MTVYAATHCPASVTRSMCDALSVTSDHTVLEPSAGSGGMVKVIHEFTQNIVAVELNADLHRELKKVCAVTYRRDFLNITPYGMAVENRRAYIELPLFDRVLMCPPAQSDAHIAHAYKFLKPGGQLCAMVQEQNIDLKRWPTYNRSELDFQYRGEKIKCGWVWLQRPY